MAVTCKSKTDFAGCCGATILYGFTWDTLKDNTLLLPMVMTEKGYTPGHIYSAILNEAQYNAFGKVLIENKFRVVSDLTVNSNSHNRLYFFLRDPETPKPLLQRMFA